MSRNATNSSFPQSVHLVSSIIIFVLSPVAVVGNALILTAIWKKTFLRTPFHVLVSGLAVSDLCTGLVAQPWTAASELFSYVHWPNTTFSPLVNIIDKIGEGVTAYFIFLMLLIVTLMSVERWIQMSRHNIVTLQQRRRYFKTIVFLLLLAIPVAVCRPLTEPFGRALYIPPVTAMLFCLFATSFAYFNVIRIIRRHRQQVQDHAPAERFGRQAINLEKYKRSVYTILYILALFYFTYLPFIISLGVYIHAGDESQRLSIFVTMSFALSFLSSSLNPCLYLWRMKDIRNGVKQLFRWSN